MQVTIQHSSLEVFDTPAQRRADCLKVLDTGAHVIAGTEKFVSGLREAAKKNDYRLYLPKQGDGWIAVRKDFIAGNVKTKFYPVLPSGSAVNDPAHPRTLKGVQVFSFDAEHHLGRIHILGGLHYLTKGQSFGQSKRDDKRCPRDHRKENIKYAKAALEVAEKLQRSGGSVFLTGDSNMFLQKDDPFFGGPASTCWNDIHRFPATHGAHCIDFVARYKKSDHVGPALKSKTRVLKGLRLNSDHRTIRATYSIKPVK